MFSKTKIVALAAIAMIGAAALVTSSSSADARPGFGGFKGGFAGGFKGRVASFAPHRPHFPNRPHWNPHRPHWHVKWNRTVVVGLGAAAIAAPAYAAAAPRPVVVAPRPVAAAPNPCTCLTKEYTQDNLVVFKDRCTNETTAAEIGGPQQQSQAQPQPGETQPLPK